MSKVLNYDDRLFIKISKEDKAKLKKLAQFNDLSMNAFVRKLINKQLEMMENQMMIYKEDMK